MNSRVLLRLRIGLISGIFAASFTFADSTMLLKDHVAPQIRNSVKLGRVAADEIVPLGLVMKLDESLLAQTLDELYGPNAPKHRQFLSSAEFAQRFGLIDKRNKLEAFAQANGLTIDPNDNRPESMLVKVSGRAAAVEKAFGVQLNHYRTADGRIFRGHETDPVIPVPLEPHLSAVTGLSNLTGIFHPRLRLAANRTGTLGRAAPAFTGTTGPNFGLAPSDIKTIYGLNSLPLTGAGQTVALFELDGYNPSDITAYEHQFTFSTPASFVSVDGTPNLCDGVNCSAQNTTTDPAMIEVALDIELVAAIAPGVSQILVYDGPNTYQGGLDIYNQIAVDDTAKAVSTSWGSPETEMTLAYVQAEAQIFQRMAAQGQSVFAAAGDDGAYDDTMNPYKTTLTVDDPAAQPLVTGVGGTSLGGSVQNPTETTWNDTYGATGGGVSSFWPIPSYQTGIAGLASQSARNVPDVALNADPVTGYSVYVAGNWFPGTVGGTSAAAPLWAAFTALLNEQRVSTGDGALGFPNPTLYSIAASAAYTSNFNDITTGNNGFYQAGSGYDNTTGWGTFKGSALINSVNNVPTLTSLSPASALVGSSSFTLTVNGTNFVTSSTVTWNGSPRATTFISSSQLQAAIDASDVAGQGTAQVAVINPITGGSQASLNSLSFNITYPTSLADVYAYPNPWDVRKNPPSTVKIANVPPGSSVKVFTVSGFHVEDLPVVNTSGSTWEAVWDLKNSSGQTVASGLYLYVVNFDRNTARGKIAVIK